MIKPNTIRPGGLIIGIVAFLIAVWGLMDAPGSGDSAAMLWGAVTIAIIAGTSMIIAGAISSRRR